MNYYPAADGECKLFANSEYGAFTITSDGVNVDYRTVEEDGLTLIVFDAEKDKEYELTYSE